MSDHDDGLGTLFDYEPPETVSPNTTCTMEFWEALKTATGANALGTIILEGDFTGEYGKKSRQEQGKVRCCAIKSGKGYKLSPRGDACENSVIVYWLPWETMKVTSAERKNFETSDCQFFMTAKLEGCRFVLTKDLVLHVANNASGALDGEFGSKTRTEAEIAVTGGKSSRRLSISNKSISNEMGWYGYGWCAFAFGIKSEGGWTYKALMKRGVDDQGTWITFIDL